MKQFLKIAAAPATALVAWAVIAVAAPTSAQAYEYCRRDITSYMVSCSFDTMEQCQAMASGRGGDCFRDPFLPASDTLAYAPRSHHVKPHAHHATVNQ
jgi:Protein of unknown function (DUF3551)